MELAQFSVQESNTFYYSLNGKVVKTHRTHVHISVIFYLANTNSKNLTRISIKSIFNQFVYVACMVNIVLKDLLAYFYADHHEYLRYWKKYINGPCPSKLTPYKFSKRIIT